MNAEDVCRLYHHDILPLISGDAHKQFCVREEKWVVLTVEELKWQRKQCQMIET